MEPKLEDNKPSIKLIKGQKDNYGWEIKAYGKDDEDPDILIAKISALNDSLLKLYGNNKDKEKGEKDADS